MDILLNYMEEGVGEPLFLLHGNSQNHRYFKYQIEFFGKLYRVIAIDTRGHGNSPRGEKPFTIDQFAEDLYEFMQIHDMPKANILGFSDGGNIALTFTLRHPKMVNKLILNGANLSTNGVKFRYQVLVEIGYKVASMFAQKSEKAKKNAEMLGLMVNDLNIRPEELRNLNVPTLVIAGTKDMIKESHTRLIYENLPKAELAILPGDHFIARRNSKVFNETVLEFLKHKYLNSG